jgi:hypothetical protein
MYCPAPTPGRFPPCTGDRKSFCDRADFPSAAACCNLEVHGCLCTNFAGGDYNSISKFSQQLERTATEQRTAQQQPQNNKNDYS